MPSFLSSLRRNQVGSTAVEFALLAPVLIGGMIAVLHVGTGLQNYNAMRSVSADVARYAVIQYASNPTPPDDTALGTWGTNQATGPAYKLRGSVSVTTPATQRVSGASEKTITVTATMPTLFDEMGLHGFTMSYTRPVFVAT